MYLKTNIFERAKRFIKVFFGDQLFESDNFAQLCLQTNIKIFFKFHTIVILFEENRCLSFLPSPKYTTAYLYSKTCICILLPLQTHNLLFDITEVLLIQKNALYCALNKCICRLMMAHK